MTRRPALKAVTANDLRGGHVVWRTASGRWSQHLADAHLWEDEAAAQIELISLDPLHKRFQGIEP